MNTLPNKYRPEFCPPHYYDSHLQQFEIIESEIQELTPKEQFVVWVISCSCLRKPDRWYSGLEKIDHNLTPQPNSAFRLSVLFEKINLKWPNKLNKDIGILDFCNSVRINPLPQSVHRSLFYFLTDRYPLEILCYEPSPKELLNIQIKGNRIITFEDDYKNWSLKKYGERDPLSFWIHDLIHADHFFKDLKNRNSQVGFYYFIREIWNNNLLEEYLLSNEFKNGFYYLISDMNAHPIHLLKTFKALIDIHQTNLPNNMPQSAWERISQLPYIASHAGAYQSFLKVNTLDFNDTDAEILTHFFELDLYRLTLS